MVEIKKYNLPDLEIFYNQDITDGYFCWIPDKTYIVLGNSNKPEQNIKEFPVKQDEIPVYKRPSGGHTVILTPNTLVFSMKFLLEKFSDPRKYFRIINQHVIDGLTELGIGNLHYRGISDLTLGNKKILGSSIYRKKNILFYHAVLNVREPVMTIERYLKHPVKEPSYRKGRTHSDFVTSLNDEGYDFSVEQVKSTLDNQLSLFFEKHPVKMI